MKFSPLSKSLLLFVAVLAVVVTSFGLTTIYYQDGRNRVSFTLTDHRGAMVSHRDLQGRHLLVFFGFTSCRDVCPTQMSKLTRLMAALDETGQGERVTPVFISVDPERDSVQRVNAYLESFHEDFIGLTGSRSRLKATADAFNTLLDRLPSDTSPGYQLDHSSIVFVVDPFSRIIDHIPFEEATDRSLKRMRQLL